MFGQFRMWSDCDRHCSFCYIDDNKRTYTDSDKVKSLMKLSSFLSDVTKDCDTVGIIGGELFQNDKYFHEWICLAETIHSADHIKRFFVGTHLLGDVDFMLEWVDMLGKEVQVCTSYDTKGRFFNDDHDRWCKNVKKVQDCGYHVVCSATLTNALVHDDIDVPDGVEFKVQPIFYTEDWLECISNRCKDPKIYNRELNNVMAKGILPNRDDALKWFSEHKEIAKEYSQYEGKHASKFWDYDKEHGCYNNEGFVCSEYRAPCGHPMIAYCYADSDRCTMCDAKEIL